MKITKRFYQFIYVIIYMLCTCCFVYEAKILLPNVPKFYAQKKLSTAHKKWLILNFHDFLQISWFLNF